METCSQHTLQNEASHANDCSGNQEIGPLPSLLPVGHSFAHGKYGDGRIGWVDRQQARPHLVDQPDYNGDASNDGGDFMGTRLVFPIHIIRPFLWMSVDDTVDYRQRDPSWAPPTAALNLYFFIIKPERVH